MNSSNGLFLQFLPPEILIKTVFPNLEPVDLLNLSKTNLWWKDKVRTYLVDFVFNTFQYSVMETPHSEATVATGTKVLEAFENLDKEAIIQDFFPLLKLVHLKIFQKINIFWNRNVKMFVENLMINSENTTPYWQEKTEDWDVLLYLNAKHFERLNLNLSWGRGCNFWQVNVRGGKIVIKTRNMNKTPNSLLGLQGLRPHSSTQKRGIGIVDIDDSEVLNY